MQVFARCVVLWGYVNPSRLAQRGWPFGLMLAAWAAIEVPRYVFYILNTLAVPVPYWLLWLRYSLSLFLYPFGIAGEIGCLVLALETMRTQAFALGLSWRQPNAWNVQYDHHLMIYVLLLLYLPGSPFMIRNMLLSRSKALAEAGGKAGKAA